MFGKSLLIDCQGCKSGVCDDLELHYRFLEEFVNKIGMTAMTPPIVIHGPRDKDGNEIYPEKYGVSGWIGLIESGIQIHSCEDDNFSTIDVYTCGELNVEAALKFVEETFQPKVLDYQTLNRGQHYRVNKSNAGKN